MTSKIFGILLAGGVLMSAGTAFAACSDDKRPTASAERRASDAVIEGNVQAKQDVKEGGLFGSFTTVYEVKVTRRMKGATSRRILVRADNATPKFKMEVGGDYLLFLQRIGADGYVLAGCGNSKTLDKFRSPEPEAEPEPEPQPKPSIVL